MFIVIIIPHRRWPLTAWPGLIKFGWSIVFRRWGLCYVAITSLQKEFIFRIPGLTLLFAVFCCRVAQYFCLLQKWRSDKRRQVNMKIILYFKLHIYNYEMLTKALILKWYCASIIPFSVFLIDSCVYLDDNML